MVSIVVGIVVVVVVEEVGIVDPREVGVMECWKAETGNSTLARLFFLG